MASHLAQMELPFFRYAWHRKQWASAELGANSTNSLKSTRAESQSSFPRNAEPRPRNAWTFSGIQVENSGELNQGVVKPPLIQASFREDQPGCDRRLPVVREQGYQIRIHEHCLGRWLALHPQAFPPCRDGH